MALIKTSIRLSKEHQAWLDGQQSGISETLRCLISAAMQDPVKEFKERKFRRAKDRFIEAVRIVFHPRRAMQLASTRPQELDKWAQDDPAGFRAEFAEAQRDFIDDAEWMVLQCAKGERYIDKQGMTGLIAFLNNHHPSWGRIKIELLSRVFNPIFDCLLNIVRETVDETTYQEIAERFQQAKALHFSAFSE